MAHETDETELDDALAASLTRITRHLPEVDDRTLIVLRGHLILEAELNDLLEDELAESEAVIDGPFSFAQRLAVLRAVLGEADYRRLNLPAVEVLNRLRNKLAHHLEHERVDDLVQTFLHAALRPEDAKAMAGRGESYRLRYALARLAAGLTGHRTRRRLLRPDRD